MRGQQIHVNIRKTQAIKNFARRQESQQKLIGRQGRTQEVWEPAWDHHEPAGSEKPPSTVHSQNHEHHFDHRGCPSQGTQDRTTVGLYLVIRLSMLV